MICTEILCPLALIICVQFQGPAFVWISIKVEGEYKCTSLYINLVQINLFLDVTFPPSILCSGSNCTHMVVYGNHFERGDWEGRTSANDTITGQKKVVFTNTRNLNNMK